MTHTLRLTLIASLLAALLLGTLPTPRAYAATFTVDSTADVADAVPGNGVCATAGSVCTLRAAIQEANALAGDDTINVPAGTYTLTIAGTNENASATGDLDINSNITVNGAGASTTIIDANGGVTSDRAFHIRLTANFNLSGVTVRNGAPTSALDNKSGGGLFHESSGTTAISNSTFTNNTATGGYGGGGIYANAGTVTVNSSTFSNNTAIGNSNGGGAIATNQDPGPTALTVSNTTFSDNTTTSANGDGAGIYSNGTLTISNSTFSNNQANATGGSGGGVWHINGAATITNSTFSGNSAKGDGGGIFYRNDLSMTLNNVTIYSNTADSDSNGGDGGGLYVSGAGTAPDVANAIIAGNVDNTGQAPDCGGSALNSQNYNLIQSITGCTINGTTTNNITGQNPSLAALASNGGSTQTHALQVGSPAIDAGNPAAPGGAFPACASTDQRGTARPVSTRCDMGAYEGSVAVAAASSACILSATFTGSATVSNGNAYYLNCFYGQVYVDNGEGRATGGNHFQGSATITANGATVCLQVPTGYTAASPTCVTDSGGGRKDFGIRPISSAQPQTTSASQSVGGGGSFDCGEWVFIIAAGSVPDGSTLHCGPFDPNAAPGAPAGFKLLAKTINIYIYDRNGSRLTSFNPPLTACYSRSGYSDADLLAAGGDPNNFVVQTGQIGGTYSELPTTVNTTTRQACGTTNHLTLFELSARVPTSLPVTGENFTPFIIAVLLVGTLAAGVFVWRRKIESLKR